jgi:flagellar basal-body rod modification protein FlgD
VATTSSVTNNSSTTATSSGAGARLSANFDTFLQLLTTQLRNQDPTQPMDANQFTQQLVQYSQVEQQLATNDKLDKLLSSFQGNQTTTALGYLGTNISFDASQSTPGTSNTTWTFTPPSGGDYTVRIRDANGTLVKEQAATLTAGSAQTFTWDNVRSDGSPVGTAAYTIELWKGSGASATQVNVVNTGKVTAVDTSSGSVKLTVGTQSIPVTKITSISI